MPWKRRRWRVGRETDQRRQFVWIDIIGYLLVGGCLLKCSRIARAVLSLASVCRSAGSTNRAEVGVAFCCGSAGSLFGARRHIDVAALRGRRAETLVGLHGMHEYQRRGKNKANDADSEMNGNRYCGGQRQLGSIHAHRPAGDRPWREHGDGENHFMGIEICVSRVVLVEGFVVERFVFGLEQRRGVGFKIARVRADSSVCGSAMLSNSAFISKFGMRPNGLLVSRDAQRERWRNSAIHLQMTPSASLRIAANQEVISAALLKPRLNPRPNLQRLGGMQVNVIDSACRFAGQPGCIVILDVIRFRVEQIPDIHLQRPGLIDMVADLGVDESGRIGLHAVVFDQRPGSKIAHAERSEQTAQGR